MTLSVAGGLKGGVPMYVERIYRNTVVARDLERFRICVGESDILVYVGKRRRGKEGPDLRTLAERSLMKYRRRLKEYISCDPLFRSTLEPYPVPPDAPEIVRRMALAGKKAGTGPMAAVAGAIAEFVGRELLEETEEVILENGGDIFMSTVLPRRVGVFAGTSPFSNRLVMMVRPESTPLGICTSSGTVGPSLSFGTADAVVITSRDSALADAVATAIGNMIKSEGDIPFGIERARQIAGVLGVIIIKGDKMGVWGEIELIG